MTAPEQSAAASPDYPPLQLQNGQRVSVDGCRAAISSEVTEPG